MPFFDSRLFRTWVLSALVVLAYLFFRYSDPGFLLQHWYYPAIMVVGAFVAGLTPEGGGAVAFPVLSVFLDIDRVLARDFSLMIQSVGMTSASIFILTRRGVDRRAYRPLLLLVPVCFVGFVLGMRWLQAIPVIIIQALFLSLITSFAIAYMASRHRGHRTVLKLTGWGERTLLVLVLLVGGACASLFGTGADIVLYTLLVTRARMEEKVATHISIMLMAAISVLGYGYRHFYDGAISSYQVQTWLCAAPVVLLMAPFGAYILSRIRTEWMLRSIVLLNIGQLIYFNLKQPSVLKLVSSGLFSAALLALFWVALARIAKRAPSAPALAGST